MGWFLALWCLILIVVLLGYFWAFWRIYGDVIQISIWEFILVPFFTVICFFLSSEFFPAPKQPENQICLQKYFIEARKPFFVTLTLLWLHLNITPLIIDFEQSFLEIFFGWVMLILSISGVFFTTIRMHKFLLLAWSTTFLSQEAVQIAIGNL